MSKAALARTVLLITIGFAGVGDAAAQVAPAQIAPAESILIPQPKNELEILGGGSFSSKRVIGQGIDGSGVGFAGLRYSRRIAGWRHIGLHYMADLYPLSFVSYPDGSGGRRTVSAISFSLPGGLRTTFLPRKKYRPFLDLGTGISYFSKRVPDERGTKLNFTAMVGAGLQTWIRHNRNVSVGYRFNHISNGGRGSFNPGFNTHDLFVSYGFKSW